MVLTHELACTGNRDDVSARLRHVLKNRIGLAGTTTDSIEGPSTTFIVQEYQPGTMLLRCNAAGDIAVRGRECIVRYRIAGSGVGYVLLTCSVGLILAALVLAGTHTLEPLAIGATIVLPVCILAFQGLAVLRSVRRLNRLLVELFKG